MTALVVCLTGSLAGLLAAAPIAANAAMQVSSHSPSQEFSPNGDQQDDVADLQYCLSAAALVTTTISPAGSPDVTRTLETARDRVSGCTPAGGLSWSGTDDQGGAAPDGRYVVRVHAVGRDGQAADTEWSLDVLRQRPGAIASPGPGELLSGTADVAFAPTDGFPHSITSFQAGAGAQMAFSAYCQGSASTAPASDGALHSQFDTAACPGTGRLSGLATYTDAFGRPHTYLVGFLVEMDGPIRVARITRSQEFSPNGDGIEDTIRLAYCLTRAATVSTTITPEGSTTVVRTFEAGVPRSADCFATGDYDSAAFTWKGRDDAAADLPDGRYTLHVNAQPARGDTTPVTVERTFAIERRVPGALTAPAGGSTIAGTTDVTYTPTAGFPYPLVSFSAFASGCHGSTTTAPGDDGAWHSALDAAGCPPGANQLRGIATYVDAFGQTHLYPAASVAVNVPAVELRLAPNRSALSTGTQLRVAGTLSQGATPLAGRRLLFAVAAGPNAPRARALSTTAAGTTEYSYYGTSPWSGAADDRITACLDADGSGTCDAGEPSQATTVHWIAARRMTVSIGTTVAADAEHTVRFANDSLFCDTVSFKSKLGFTYAQRDGTDPHTFVLTSLPAHRCWDDASVTPGGVVDFDSMEGAGTGTLDGASGYSIRFSLVDRGESGPAAGDTVDVSVSDPAGVTVLSFAAPLTAGNLNAYQGELLAP